MKGVWGMRTCREATRLMVQAEAERLRLGDRLALAWHVRLCRACQRFQSQMRLMSSATRAWRAYSERAIDAD
jgi:hypothetical protein